VRILKGFKSCVLEVRILKGLQVDFAEVRILKGLVTIGLTPEEAGLAARLKGKWAAAANGDSSTSIGLGQAVGTESTKIRWRAQED
jgi:hypothetical protein